MSHMVRRIAGLVSPLLLSWAPGALAATTAEVQYYHLDGLQSVRALSDAAGALVPGETRSYLPFGEEWCGGSPCAPSAVNGQPKRFTAKERDAETGLDYFGARYYRGSAARFTTVDPHLDQPRGLVQPQSWNRYAYANNNPLRYVDPDGRDAVVLVWTPGNDAVGHSAIAVQNRDADGRPTGDFTLYDLWPQSSEEVNQTLKSRGDYRQQVVKESELMTLGAGEGRAADGIIRIKGDARQDAATSARLKALAAENADYVAPSNTCSTYCKAGIEAAGLAVPQTGTVTASWYGIPLRREGVVTPVSVYNSLASSGDPRVQVIRPLPPDRRSPDLTMR